MSETLAARTEQAVRSPADVYDEQFVPALFRPWGPVLCDAARIAPGQRVLDVACGTGALTIAVAARVAPGGAVARARCQPADAGGGAAQTSGHRRGTTAAPSRCPSPTRASTPSSASSA